MESTFGHVLQSTTLDSVYSTFSSAMNAQGFGFVVTSPWSSCAQETAGIDCIGFHPPISCCTTVEPPRSLPLSRSFGLPRRQFRVPYDFQFVTHHFRSCLCVFQTPHSFCRVFYMAFYVAYERLNRSLQKCGFNVTDADCVPRSLRRARRSRPRMCKYSVYSKDDGSVVADDTIRSAC